MFNKNFVVYFNGTEAISVEETDTQVKVTGSDLWGYNHNNIVSKEKIEYGFKAVEGKDYQHRVYASFYNEFPLDGFDYSFPMIHGGVNIKNFAKEKARQYICGSCGTPQQQEYAAAVYDNYLINRD